MPPTVSLQEEAPSRRLRHPSVRTPLAVLIDAIDMACDGDGEPCAEQIVTALRAAVVWQDLLTADQRMPQGSCYARHLLHEDPAGRYTIVAIVWDPGQFSPSHGHHAWCAYAVHENALEETLYAWDDAEQTARPIAVDVRPPGYGCFARAGLDQIHRLGNSGTEPGISIHVYGVDGARVRTHVNRVVEVA
jgi:predicted metal-dependent enzyme (double-stranded beta helix superfamily)